MGIDQTLTDFSIHQYSHLSLSKLKLALLLAWQKLEMETYHLFLILIDSFETFHSGVAVYLQCSIFYFTLEFTLFP